MTEEVATGIHSGEPSRRLSDYDHTEFRIIFNSPNNWNALSDEAKNELSIRIGQVVAFDIATWHEIITWFGYGTTVFFSEKPSAFTYDDVMSHVVGINVAASALRKPSGTWNANATAALSEELRELRVVSRNEAARAVALVANQWWSRGFCLRRMIDVGDRDGNVRPWLVRELSSGKRFGQPFPLPTLQNVKGHELSTFFTLMVKPSSKIRALFRPTVEIPIELNASAHFPWLIEIVRYQIKSELGYTALQPYDDTTADTSLDQPPIQQSPAER